MTVQLSERIEFITAPDKARFPYCHCLLIADECRALIDTSFGAQHLQHYLRAPLDIIVNTHFHEDHILNNHHFPNAQVWMHALDAPAARSLPIFLDYYGFNEYEGQNLGREFIDSIDLHPSPVHRELADGDVLDFGHVKLRVVHTPGHTPGHCAFFEEKSGLLFSADIDLSGFGPWYAHRCSNIDDFLRSIQICIDLDPRIIVSSHKGIIKDDLKGRLHRYAEIIYRKEEELIRVLGVPQTIEELALHQVFYGEANRLTPLLMWFEKMAVKQHLQRLTAHQQVVQSEGVYYLK